MPYGLELHDIGGFEIGPDEDHPAENGEISSGGDSGSAWMAGDDEGDAPDMMVGLHFAAGAGGPPDPAPACQAASVFEKLEIRPLAPPTPGAIEVVSPIGGGYDPRLLARHQLPPPATGGAA